MAGRNIVVCCDGTSNKFGRQNTNVVRLVESLKKDSPEQLFYYDPGVGTLPLPGLSNPVKWTKWVLWTLADLAVGWGLEQNVEEAYAYLMDVWEPEDRIFLFGFSRGSYTVRDLAGLLNALGLLRRNQTNLISYLMAIYKSIDKGCFTCKSKKNRYWKLCAQFRHCFARETGVGRNLPIYFLALWDTVSSYGWLWNPRIYAHTADLSNVQIIRHTVSIDEHRAFFHQNLVRENSSRDVKQYWFPGVHADIGGGYVENGGGLWRVTFEWMLAEATAAGILIDNDMLDHVRNRSAVPERPWLEYRHKSLLFAPWWWIAEFVPKFHPHRCSARVNLFRARTISNGAKIHRSAILRLQDDRWYRPWNFSPKFIRIQDIDPVPEIVRYQVDR